MYLARKKPTSPREEQVLVNLPLQNRQLGSAEPRIKRARLTQKNLAEFNKMSKKNSDTKRVGKANNEATVVIETSWRLLKEYDDDDDGHDQGCTGLPEDLGLNCGLSTLQPDFVEGLEKEEFRPFPVDEYVPGAALHQDDPHSITLPHIAGEWAGDMREATVQSAYSGAAMVYARSQALAYMGEQDPPGHASVTTFATDGTNLNIYAHYATPVEGDESRLEYHQYLISSTNLKSTYQGYKDGWRSLRNAQDYAKGQSEQLRDRLKEYWKQNRDKLAPVAVGVNPPNVEPPPQATDGDEDASLNVL
ncbi:hypothetical protein F5144DRAFT_617330 [Chaetomium tenue]|uniref:Uncharacterized protein n=1 Tax=Chaetomium tenue TaxID=1854479 RepID=A0ACB7PQ49_9PEZI|nr:hypothetical protein F5144DRAFT_617330 [Chaetomium globosum]